MGTELDAKRLEILAELLLRAAPCFCLQTRRHIARPALNATAASLELTLREALVSTSRKSNRRCAKPKTKALLG